MDSETLFIRPDARELKDQPLNIKNAGLIGEFLFGLMQGHQTLSRLTSEVPEFNDGGHLELKKTYVGVLLATCAAAARNHRVRVGELVELLGMKTNFTLRTHVDIAVGAGHLYKERDATDARGTFILPTERTMQVFLDDMSAIARLVTKIAHLQNEEVESLRSLISGRGEDRAPVL